MYQTIAETWLAEGQAYYCFLTDDEITAQKEEAKAKGRPYQLQSPYRDGCLQAAKARLASGETATVRFKCATAKASYTFEDMVRGTVTLPSHMVGDFVILRSGGMPVYNFCCAVDDAKMGDHVFRGEEHLPNTLRQLMIYEVLQATPPQFGHLSLFGRGQEKAQQTSGRGQL